MKKQWICFALIFVAILPILILRDFAANNELKYLSIADEAIENSHIFAFYNHGAEYADKPPLYFWFVMLYRVLFGKHIMLCVSLLSVIPAFVTAWVMGRFTERTLSESSRCSALLLLFTTAYFLASIIVLRMDMLMTMFITLALYTFYRMYEYDSRCSGERSAEYRRWQWQLPLYIFLALFSKGPVGLIMPLLVIVIFLGTGGRLKSIGRYLGWRCWLLLSLLSALWFTGVYLDGDKDYLYNLLFHQTIDRAADAFHHKKPIYYYLITYWFTMAPWSLLTFAAIITAYRQRLLKDPLIRFFITIFFTTIVMLSLISSKLEIYLLPAFPFLIYFTAMIMDRRPGGLMKGTIAIVAILFIAIFALSCLMGPISQKFALPEIELTAPLCSYTSILLAGGTLSLFALYKKRIFRATDSITISLLLFIFCASFSIPSLNKYIGMKEGCAFVLDKAEEYGISDYLHYNFHTSENFDVYFKQFLKEEGKSKEERENFKIREISKEQIPALHNSILFLKSTHIAKDEQLARMIEECETYRYGISTIIIFR